MLRLLGALGIGAAAMYFLDPENGRKRWALARGKFMHYRKELTTYAERRRSPRRAASAVDIDLSQSQR